MRQRQRRKYQLKERVCLVVMIILGIFVPTAVVYTQAALSKSDIEVESLKSKVTRQKENNQSLSMQVDELASLSNIQGIAKEYGLSYNNDNIIVIDN